MGIVPLDRANLPAFRRYCLEHRQEHDESYLEPEDLCEAELLQQEGDPSFLLLAPDGGVSGAASLMLARFKPLGKGRFRILHALSPEPGSYRALVEAVLPFARGRASVYLFLPKERTDVAHILAGLGFAVTRRAFLLERRAWPMPEPVWPAGYTLRPFRQDVDAAVWCGLINAAFAPLPAHTDLTPAMLRGALERSTYLAGGLLMLWHGDQPAAVVRVSRENDEGREIAFIEQVAVLPTYQHQGLGRGMLRAAVRFGAGMGLPVTQLSVNTENEKAVALYLSEGFREKRAVFCYELQLAH